MKIFKFNTFLRETQKLSQLTSVVNSQKRKWFYIYYYLLFKKSQSNRNFVFSVGN